MGVILRAACGLARSGGGVRHVRLAASAILLAGLAAAPLAAEQSHDATTSDAARREAVAAIPLAKIDKRHRQAVRAIISSPSVYRRMPTSVIDCRPEMFTYFAENPEVLVAIWRHMGLSQVELTRTGPDTLRLADGAGATGKLVIVEQSCDASAQNRIVIHAEGAYDGKPFVRPITAECVLLLRSGSVVETNGRTYVAARLDTFIKLDRPTIEVLAKAAHPFVGKTADRNFADTLAFVSNLSYTAQVRTEAVEQLAERVDGIDAPRRDRLAAVARQCGAAQDTLELSRAEGPIVEVSPR